MVYAGSLDDIRGIELMCEIPQKIKNLNISIYGKGSLENLVKEKSKEFDCLKYYGMIDKNEVLQIEKNADILILLMKPNNNSATSYGIPYKIFEYLASGVPVISTMIESIPTEFNNYINICDYNLDSICSIISNIEDNYDYYKSKALKAKKYVESNCSWKKISNKIIDFISQEE